MSSLTCASPRLSLPNVLAGFLTLHLFGVWTASGLHAQEVRTLTERQSCADCRIVLEPAAVLGADHGAGFVGYTNTMARDTARYFLAFHGATDEIRVFGSDGQFLRLLGRSGSGPGEYRRITGLSVGPNDSLYVFDGRASRLTVYTPQLEVARTARVLVSSDSEKVLHVRADGTVLLHGRSPARSSEVQMLDEEGAIVRSIEDQNAASPGVGRWFASAPDSGFWVAHFDQYLLERRSAQGDLLYVIRGSDDWFRSTGEEATDPGEAAPPKPSILDISVDRDGLIWILGKTPHPQWRQSLDEIERRIPRPEVYWASVLEVIDPSGPSVVAQRIMEGPDIRGFVGSGQVFTYFETPRGIPRIQISRVRLER